MLSLSVFQTGLMKKETAIRLPPFRGECGWRCRFAGGAAGWGAPKGMPYQRLQS